MGENYPVIIQVITLMIGIRARAMLGALRVRRPPRQESVRTSLLSCVGGVCVLAPCQALRATATMQDTTLAHQEAPSDFANCTPKRAQRQFALRHWVRTLSTPSQAQVLPHQRVMQSPSCQPFWAVVGL